MTSSRRLGIDVGGTKCMAVVLDPGGAVIAEQRRQTPKSSGAIIEAVAELAGALQPWDSIGVGMPGLVTRTGVLRAAPNLVGIEDLAVGKLLGDRLACVVHVDSDATCAAGAEWKVGAARGVDDFVMVTLGTGIGGGVVVGGALVRGANGFAGEIGHMVVDPDGPPCPCGRRGCWERYASGSGLVWLANTFRDGRGVVRAAELAGGDPAAVRGQHVADAAREGDSDALEVVGEYGRWVALGLVNLTNVLDPEMFVLGGGLAQDAELFLTPIREWFGQLLYAPELRPHPVIAFAQLGERAGAIGAALLAEVH
ncbi:MAG: ROK family protein [Actinobacteria bacterium]|nr:ROK family protein [Actinomycetota bacterium]